MAKLELAFESGDDSLSVRRFSVHEAMSEPFIVSILARSPNEDIDLESIVGRPASFRMTNGLAFAQAGAHSLHGICCHMEQLASETTGLSTYHLRIVPTLWLLGQKTNHRLFQHVSVPEIVEKLLKEWDIPHDFQLNRDQYPRLELRVQYGESDLAFLQRLLEEAGISYYFTDEAPASVQKKSGKEKTAPASYMILTDKPHTAEPRAGGPLRYVDKPNPSAEQEYVTEVRLGQVVRPGKVTQRDHDFRRRPTFALFGQQSAGHTLEEMLEQYKYAPGAALTELAPDEIAKLGEVFRGVPGIVQDVVGKAQSVADKAQSVATGATGKAASAATTGLGDKIEKKAHDFVENKVEGFVEGKVKDAVSGLGGEILGEVAGGIAGGIAGLGAGKLAGFLASGLGRLLGDDKGFARHTEKAVLTRSNVALEALRADRRSVSFSTNALDIGPGMVLSLGHHPRKDLAADKRLLVVSSSLEGTHDGEWVQSAEAVFASVPYRTAQRTAKPSILGLQSAVVVGPTGEEIHTDEHGRVRVQFHWDRENQYTPDSSCWMRVSQGWAGMGFGMITIPRVGQEVLVGFLEGDPDQPVIMGRLFNGTARPPYDLPQHKSRSGWRSDSTPGSGGYNEIMFEDAKGRELVYMQAERDLDTVVKRNEARSIGVDRQTNVGSVDASLIGARYNVTMKEAESKENKVGPTFFEMVDGRIVFSTGEASITLDGPNITLEAKGRIFVHSTDDDVEILGGPWVKINCGPVPEGESDTVTMHHITGVVRDQDEEPLKGQTVVVKASDGSVQQVQTDGTGRYFALVPPGRCQVSLPGGMRYGTQGGNLDTMNEEAEEFEDGGEVT